MVCDGFADAVLDADADADADGTRPGNGDEDEDVVTWCVGVTLCVVLYCTLRDTSLPGAERRQTGQGLRGHLIRVGVAPRAQQSDQIPGGYWQKATSCL